MSAASLCCGAVALLLSLVCALSAGGPAAAAAGLLGGAPVLASGAVSLVLGACAERPWRPDRRPRDPAAGLLVGYVLKCLAGILLLSVVRVPAGWPGGWVLACAVVSVLAMLAGEVLAVLRMRIPYFSPVDAAETESGAR